MTVFAVIFSFFVAVNAIQSQMFPLLYFESIKNEKDTAASYLKSIHNLPQFQTELADLVTLYGPALKEEVFHDDRVRLEYIKKLETLHEQNPAARDVNYQLSLLYAQTGDVKKSAEHLERARAVDPSL